MQTRPLPLRVAVVQMHAHLAVEAPGHVFLGEPLGETSNTPILGRLHTRLPPDSPLLPDLERLQRSIATAYARGLLARLRHILEFCTTHGTQLAIFPEYSIPGRLIPDLRKLVDSGDTLALVAGTHHVTDDLLLDPSYRACFGDCLPPINHAIAPILQPGQSTSFQLKLWRSQWEPFLALGKDPALFTHRDVTFGVAVCIDFLRHRDGDSAEIHQKWTEKAQLIVVTSATPGDSPRAFEASARDLFQHFQIPVAFSNLASDGGSSIFAFGKAGGEPLAAETTLPPLPGSHEGVCILELQLHQPAKSKPTHLLHTAPAQPIAYALVRPTRADPQLALAATALARARDPAAFRAVCREHQATLARASREFADVELVQRRWDRLAKGARGIHDIEQLHRLAADLWLPDDVLSIPEIEHALTAGAIQVLRGLAERGVSEQDRKECNLTLQLLERASERLPVDKERASNPEARTIREHVVSILAPPQVSASVSPIRADGRVDAWTPDPGAPPAPLLGAGLRLWPRAQLDRDDIAPAVEGGRGPAELIGYLEDMDNAATSLAIQGSPPSWVGWSPRGTPVLVVAPAHIILVSHVVPKSQDLALARANASKPLPVALLIGPSERITVPLPPDLLPLPQAIRRLAVDDEHLRELADFEYSPARIDFIEPTCVAGFDAAESAAIPGIEALDTWHATGARTAVLCGTLGDGRTTLVRTWLADLARTALLGDGPPVLYVDGASWREHSNLSSLLSRFSPTRLAALRLAVATGNCLLVLDGFDDIRPTQVLKHSFFAGWLDPDAYPRLLLVSCWPESPGDLLQLQHISADEPWPEMARSAYLGRIPRSVIAAARNDRELFHPSPDLLRALVAGYASALASIVPTPSTASPVALLLEDLARALWSPRPTKNFAAIEESEFRRLRSQWRPRGGDPDRILRILEKLDQDLVGFTRGSSHTPTPPRWRWLTPHAEFRSDPVLPSNTFDENLRLSFAFDPLFDFALAEAIVRGLTDEDPSPLALLPLHPDTIDYCLRHPRWPDARATVQRLLGATPSTPAASLNALLLATADPAMASTRDAPWQLPGLDLRLLKLDEARLDHADLSNAQLAHASLRSASLRHAKLAGTLFEGADLRQADLTGAHLTGASLTGTNLDGTRFVTADLAHADLSRSIASEKSPDFTDARLEGAVAHAAAWSDPSLSTDQLSRLITTWSAPSIPVQVDEVIAPPAFYEGAIAWSSDDNIIATGDLRGALWLWASGPLRGVAHRQAHTQTLRAIAFSPDGKLIATSADNDLNVRLWNASDLEPAGELLHDKPVTGLFWEAPDSLWAFSGTPRRWNPTDHTFEDFTAIADAYEGLVTMDGAYLVTIARGTSQSQSVSIFDRNTVAQVAKIETTTARLPSIDRRHNRLLENTGLALKIHQVSPTSPVLRTLDASELFTGALSPHPLDTWSPSGRFLGLLSNSRRLRLHDTASGALRRTIGAGLVGALFANHHDRVLAFTAKALAVFDAHTGTLARSRLPKRLDGWALDLTWTAEGLQYHNNGHVVDLALARRKLRRETRDTDLQLGGHAPEPNRQRNSYIFSDGDGYALWNTESQQRLLLERRHVASERTGYGGAPLASWSPDGAFVMIQRAVSGERFECTIWDSASGFCIIHTLLPDWGGVLLVYKGHAYPLVGPSSRSGLHCISVEQRTRISICGGFTGRAFADDSGRHIAFTRPTSPLTVLDTTSLLQDLASMPAGDHRELRPADAPTRSISSHPNTGAVALLSTHDIMAFVTLYEVHVHRISDGEHLHTLPTRMGMSTALAFTPDGKHLACHFFGDIQIWNIEREEVIARLILLEDGALAIAGREFQRLSPPKSPPPSLEGFYARAGVHLHPLDRLAHLESTTLCADLWKTLSAAPAPALEHPESAG